MAPVEFVSEAFADSETDGAMTACALDDSVDDPDSDWSAAVDVAAVSESEALADSDVVTVPDEVEASPESPADPLSL